MPIKEKGYPLCCNINDDECKLSKVDFFGWQCVSSEQDLSNVNDLWLYINGDYDSKDLNIFDVKLVDVSYENCEKIFNILWTAQISTFSVLLTSIANNISFGKVKLLLETKEEEIEIFLVITSTCFGIYDDPTDTTNLKATIYFREHLNRKVLNKNMDSIKPIFQSFFVLTDHCVQYSTERHVEKKNIMDLYEYVKIHHRNVGDMSVDFRHKYQHELLLPSLRNYQAHAVHWMISREKGIDYETGIFSFTFIIIP